MGDDGWFCLLEPRGWHAVQKVGTIVLQKDILEVTTLTFYTELQKDRSLSEVHELIIGHEGSIRFQLSPVMPQMPHSVAWVSPCELQVKYHPDNVPLLTPHM